MNHQNEGVFVFENLSLGLEKRGDGFDRQRDTFLRHFQTKSKFFKNSKMGVRGTKDGFDRTGLTEVIVALKVNRIRLVLVEYADRVARDLASISALKIPKLPFQEVFNTLGRECFPGGRLKTARI